MTARRQADFALERALEDPGFTPRVRDVPALLDLLAGARDRADPSEHALERVGLPAARAAALRIGSAAPGLRRRLVRLVGAIARSSEAEELRAVLATGIVDAEPSVRRAAAMAIGKLPPSEDATKALSRALASETDAPTRKALIEALGKVGGTGALEAVSAAGGADPELERVRSKAMLMVTRTEARAAPSRVDLARAATIPTAVTLHCRAGLERILLEEVTDAVARGKMALSEPRLAHDRFGSSGRVLATLRGAPSELLVARTALSFGFPLEPIAATGELEDAVVRALVSERARAVFDRWSEGPVRYRIAWAGGGKRRALVWRAAEDVARQHPELVNDPTRSTWEAVVREASGSVLVELVPRFDDPRFAYRLRDVPAASHPTIAAALARLCGVAVDAVVWDPFVGSGTELCERALAGPYRLLIGSDREAAALEVVRGNLDALGVRGVVLARGDATSYVPPEPPTAIVTNPPLGRRVARGADLAETLDRFVEHAAGVLAPGGRLVWISPFGQRTTVLARRLGMKVELRQDVDMGGFTAQLQVLRSAGVRTAPKRLPPEARARR